MHANGRNDHCAVLYKVPASLQQVKRVELHKTQSDNRYRNDYDFLNCATDDTFQFPLSSGEELLQRHMRINEALLCYALPLSA